MDLNIIWINIYLIYNDLFPEKLKYIIYIIK